MRIGSFLAATILFFSVCAVGCSSRHETVILNSLEYPKSVPSQNHTRAETRFVVADQSAAPDKDWFVGVAVSGGGSRAANFTAGCLFALEDAHIMQHVQYISSVSGGSVAAAYYCASPDWNYEDVQSRLIHQFQADVLAGVIAPWEWPRFFYMDWNRSDVLASSLERVLYTDPHRHGRALTFDDLRPDRPRLLINATDLQTGKSFVFCNTSFNAINSKLACYPISNAVAASAAFPGGLAPLPLRDHTSGSALKRYVHLVDGGVADNTGLQTLGQTFLDQITEDPARYSRGAMIFIIDSSTDYNTDLSNKSDIGFWAGIFSNIDLGLSQLLDIARDATLGNLVLRGAPDDARAADLVSRLKQLKDTGHAEFHDRRGKPIYVVRLALRDVRRLDDLPSPGFGLEVSTVSTSFNIDKDQASDLYVAARHLAGNDNWLKPTLKSLAEILKSGERP